MSNTDSFIDEVSEEVRRDRLYLLLRRYGWIAVVAIVLLVGGASYNEWRKAQDRAAAQAFGSALLNALELDDGAARIAALAAVTASSAEQQALLALLNAAALDTDGKSDEAAAVLARVAEKTDLSEGYRHLARLKLVALAQSTPAERLAALAPLMIPGAPYRGQAMEQSALIMIEAGDRDGAITRLREISADQAASSGLRRRASQLIVALGGKLEAA